MTARASILKVRSHIAFSVGLCLAAGIALSMETGVATSLRGPAGALIIPTKDQVELAPIGALSEQDMNAARLAWQYFEKNYQPETGLVNSVNNYPSTTIWDQASYLLGLISAERIGLIDRAKFDHRMGLALRTLGRIELFEGQLPNKVYHTQTLAMTNYANAPVEQGIGWSALDVARMSVPLNILLYDYPDHAGASAQIIQNWDFSSMLKNGEMFGARVNPETNQSETVQEGRLGYEEYAARAIGLLGLDALSAMKYDDYLNFVPVSGQQIAIDSRSFSEFDAHNYVVSEPYILAAIEFGLDTEARELADRIYRAQEGRFKNAGILTAVSEDNLDQEPYFLYNTVYANGVAWNPLAEDGSSHTDKRTVSTKAVFGWDALFQTEYTDRLLEHIDVAKTTDSGWNSGIYESDGRVNAVSTANTNGIILEALQYKLNGPLVTGRFNRKDEQ
ncbi:hypothetical protein GCM10007939_16580 [Amylibacter marinus]|uniref:DUF3131 domain-containing protein n=1 Tax=Amylibacter marinus TaxID=1475483 RepID=A0ABQ5VVC4_9RHOB|nr:DUF3131 domain-containing protein [Amylibacter marinus]GLQ35375.1 hypothetical protein GCM10007939_16580 [Amylibacter marinus]